MDKVFFMGPFIRDFSKYEIFRKVFATVLRVIAVLTAVGGFVVWVLMWKLVFEIPSAGVAGGIIFQLFFLVAIYMVVHAIFLRAKHIAGLPRGKYPIIPVISLFLKLVGEAYAAFTAAIAVGGGILLWFAGGYGLELLENVSRYVPKYEGGTTFLSGILFLVVGIIFAFFTLVSFYFVSQLLVVFVDIAKNTGDLKKSSTRTQSSSKKS
ncbi:hypothetical protein KGY73_08220 [bacterium]|nr:hypothetical protein [bacterium]